MRYTIARVPGDAVLFSLGFFGARFDSAPCGHGASLKFPRRGLFFVIFFVDFRFTKIYTERTRHGSFFHAGNNGKAVGDETMTNQIKDDSWDIEALDDIEWEDPDYKYRKRIETTLRGIVDDSAFFNQNRRYETLCGAYYDNVEGLGLVQYMDEFWDRWDRVMATDVEKVVETVADCILWQLKIHGLVDSIDAYMGALFKRYKWRDMFLIRYTNDGGRLDVAVKYNVLVNTLLCDTIDEMKGETK